MVTDKGRQGQLSLAVETDRGETWLIENVDETDYSITPNAELKISRKALKDVIVF